jgi:hypothetical protein
MFSSHQQNLLKTSTKNKRQKRVAPGRYQLSRGRPLECVEKGGGAWKYVDILGGSSHLVSGL